LDGSRHHEAIDDVGDVLVFVVDVIGIEPRCTLLHEMPTQRDLLCRNDFDQSEDRWERIAGTDSDGHVVAISEGQVGLGSVNECPGQVTFAYVSDC